MKALLSNKKLILGSLIFSIVCLVALFFLKSYVGRNPFSEVVLSDISDFTICDDGSLVVLNNTGLEVVTINSDKKIDGFISGKSTRNDSFYRGLFVAADANRNIYILNKQSDAASGSSISKEEVLVFNSSGRKLKSVLEIEHNPSVFRPTVCALSNVNDTVYAIMATDSEVIVKDLAGSSSQSYPLFDANYYVSAATLGNSPDELYLILRNGRILREDAGVLSQVYELNSQDTDTVLSDICISKDSEIYVSDIGNLNVSKCLETGELVSQFETEDPAYKILSFGQNIITESTYGISEFDQTSLATSLSFSYTLKVALLISLTWLLLVTGACAVLFALLAALYAFFVRADSHTKTLFYMTAFSVLLTALFCLLMRMNVTNLKNDDAMNRMENDVVLLDTLIDGDAFAKLVSMADYDSESYKSVKDACDRVILDKGSEVSNFYTILYSLKDDDEVYVRYSTEENYGSNYPYIWSDGTDERAIYDTKEITVFPEPVSDPTGTFINVYGPLTDSCGNVVGVIEVGCDCDALNREASMGILNLAVSIFALMIVILLVLVEGAQYLKERTKAIDMATNPKEAKPSLAMYRLIVFLVFFVTNITTPFLSIYSLELAGNYSELFHVSTEVLSAIPLSAEVLFGALFSILGNKIILRLNRRKSAFLGFVLFFVGLVIRFVYPDFIVLTIGNGMQGAGWGILLLIVNSTIASSSDEEEKESGFTNYNIALQNGMNSGVVAGGFLLLFLNHVSVLVIAAALSLLMFPFIKRFVFDSPLIKEDDEHKKTSLAREYTRFIFKPRVLLYFLGIVFPVIAASYYLIYLYPIMGNNMGISETMIGYSYLVTGIVTIFFSNIIVKFVSKHFSKKVSLVLASLIYLVTFVLIGVFQSIPVLLIALVLLPVSDSFGYVIQETYYSDLPETEALGYEKAMGVYSLFENLAQATGSMVFGYVLAVGVGRGMMVFGVVIGAMALLFGILSKK